jgi:hypothetical protein
MRNAERQVQKLPSSWVAIKYPGIRGNLYALVDAADDKKAI